MESRSNGKELTDEERIILEKAAKIKARLRRLRAEHAAGLKTEKSNNTAQHNVAELTTRVERAEAENSELKRQNLEYKNATTWDTTCFNCSHLLDKNYSDYMRAEHIETALAEAENKLDRLIDLVVDLTDPQRPLGAQLLNGMRDILDDRAARKEL